MTGKTDSPAVISALAASVMLVLSNCSGPDRDSELRAELEELLTKFPKLSETPWEHINEIGLPLAARQATIEKCFGASDGEFSNFLYDLKSAGVSENLIQDMRDAGEYTASNVSCESEFIQVTGKAAAQAQKMWRSRMKIERMIQAREQ